MWVIGEAATFSITCDGARVMEIFHMCDTMVDDVKMGLSLTLFVMRKWEVLG